MLELAVQNEHERLQTVDDREHDQCRERYRLVFCSDEVDQLHRAVSTLASSWAEEQAHVCDVRDAAASR